MNLTVEMLGYLLRFIAFNREQYNIDSFLLSALTILGCQCCDDAVLINCLIILIINYFNNRLIQIQLINHCSPSAACRLPEVNFWEFVFNKSWTFVIFV